MDIFRTCFLIVFLSAFIFSPKNSAQSAFPLSEGNSWFYTINYHFTNPPVPVSYFNYTVAGDTLMPNGKTYYILEPRDMFDEKYIRSDSQYVYYYSDGEEKKVFDLNATPHEPAIISWAAFMQATLDDTAEAIFFNRASLIYNFSLGGLQFADISLTKKFGYTAYEFFGDGDRNEVWELTGCIINDTIYGSITGISSDEKIPEEFALFQNYPNPFNPVTKFEFSIPSSDKIILSIYNSLGQLLNVLIDKELVAGKYSIQWNASAYPSGVYYYKIESKYFSQVKKCILLK